MERFPRRIYTLEEYVRARKSIEDGHKHRLRVIGNPDFRKKVKEILSLIRKANYYDLIRTYIRKISEIEGIGQLREAEATIWLNNYIIRNPIEGARFIVQKTHQMKAYLDGKKYYLEGERRAIQSSVIFLKKLEERLTDGEIKALCVKTIKQWTEETVL